MLDRPPPRSPVSSLCALCAEITEDLPSRDVLLRWLGEPVKAIIVPTSIFLTNKKGYPVLSRVRLTPPHHSLLLDHIILHSRRSIDVSVCVALRPDVFLCGLQAHQAFLQDLYRYKIQLLLKGKPRHAGGHAVYLQVQTHGTPHTLELGTPCRAYIGLFVPDVGGGWRHLAGRRCV